MRILIHSHRSIVLWMIMLILSASTALAQTQPASTGAPMPPNVNPAQHVVYPAQGQSQEQILSDMLEAYRWATTQTNWDPYQAYDELVEKGYVAERKADEAQGGMVRGAAGGALAGLAIGAIAGDAGKGAAIGAVAGGLTGGIRSHRRQSEAEAEMQQAIDAFSRQFELWDRNYVAVLQGKGYSVQ